MHPKRSLPPAPCPPCRPTPPLPGAIATLVCLIFGLGACHQAAAPTPAFVDLGRDYADAGDHLAQIAVLERRLARLAPDDPDLPAALESLALACVEAADVNLGGDTDTYTLRRAAIDHFQRLRRDFPAYEGSPAALLMAAYEAQSLHEAAERDALLTDLVSHYPGSDPALDALVLLGLAAIEAKDFAAAHTWLSQLRRADPSGERGRYASFLSAWVHFSQEDYAAACATLGESLHGPAPDPDLRHQILALLPRACAAPEMSGSAMAAELARFGLDGEVYRRVLADLATHLEALGKTAERAEVQAILAPL